MDETKPRIYIEAELSPALNVVERFCIALGYLVTTRLMSRGEVAAHHDMVMEAARLGVADVRFMCRQYPERKKPDGKNS